MRPVKKIYIDAAHSRFAPGAVCAGRNEHRDCLRLACLLYENLIGYPQAEVMFYPGEDAPPEKRLLKAEKAGADTVIIFHRAWASDKGPSDGARIIVPEKSGCQVLYEAELLLNAFCLKSGIKNRGVHLSIKNGVHKSIDKSGIERIFLVEAGFSDSLNDCIKSDVYGPDAARAMAEVIGNMLKEGNVYENNTAV